MLINKHTPPVLQGSKSPLENIILEAVPMAVVNKRYNNINMTYSTANLHPNIVFSSIQFVW